MYGVSILRLPPVGYPQRLSLIKFIAQQLPRPRDVIFQMFDQLLGDIEFQRMMVLHLRGCELHPPASAWFDEVLTDDDTGEILQPQRPSGQQSNLKAVSIQCCVTPFSVDGSSCTSHQRKPKFNECGGLLQPL